MIKVMTCILLILGFTAGTYAEMRLWTDSKGRKMEAELVSYTDSTVTLKRANGAEGILQRSDLSLEDQTYLDAQEEPTDEPAVWDIFGSNKDTGNELVGTFYDLKKRANGKPSAIGKMLQAGSNPNKEYIDVLDSFDRSWKRSPLEEYYKAPVKKYASFFAIPTISASSPAIMEAFGVQGEVAPRYWAIHYKGEISAPETGRFRFCGLGDDVLLVKVDGELVLDACGVHPPETFTSWESPDKNSRKFKLAHGYMVIGDWIELKQGQRIDMEVLMGEMAGGTTCAILLIEQAGKQYDVATEVNGSDQIIRRILPIFKTTEIPEKLVPQLKKLTGQATISGPVFDGHSNSK